MALKEILVHIDHYASSAARLAVAVGLAKRQGARLTGLLVVRHQNPVAEGVVAAQDMFEQQVAEAGIHGRWLCLDGSALEAGTTEIVLAYGRCSDLLIIGQTSRDSVNVGVPFDLPERVVLEAGRPVLVVPYAGTFATVGMQVLVAWKAGRESVRAVHDALPLLQQAARVDILAKSGSEKFREDGATLCADVCALLSRHGVAAMAHHLPLADMPLGDALLNRVFDEGFDLLVMGAYAYGHEGQMALGSVARQMLKQMTVPVLMSH